MLVLAMIAMLASPPTPAAAPASLPRVPGMRLRLGMSESQVLAIGSFVTVPGTVAGGISRKGPARFFGVPGEATCTLKDGMLTEVRFEATGVGPQSEDYVDGQLRMMRLTRECQPDQSGDRTCDWISPVLKVHTESKKDRLTAHTMLWPPPPKHAPDSLHAAAKPATGGAAAATLATGLAVAPPRDSTAVTTLPETLSITVANRNTQGWPRILSSPPLHYPAKARQESLQGVVWVRALVDPSGKVLEAAIERSIKDLDPAALAWVKGSQFAPCEKDGAPCRFVVRVAVLFTLY